MIDINKIKEHKTIEELLNFSIININKPSGITSFDACDKLRDLLKLNKTGHFGTLDPNVTGVLPISLNRACKLSKYFMKSDKEYIGKMKIHSKINHKDLNTSIEKYIGKIKQLPPKKSNVKRKFREREIFDFKINSFDEKKILLVFMLSLNLEHISEN
jgi:H/ACA ribonucleoprotein complex subunit 4